MHLNRLESFQNAFNVLSNQEDEFLNNDDDDESEENSDEDTYETQVLDKVH
jgi:hypothetical protein